MGTSHRTAPRHSWTPCDVTSPGCSVPTWTGSRSWRARWRPWTSWCRRGRSHPARACSSRRRSGVPTSSCWNGHGLVTEPIPTDADGVVDLEALAGRLGSADAGRRPGRPGLGPPWAGAAGRRDRRAGPRARRTCLAGRGTVRGPRRRTAWCRRRRRDQPQVADRSPWGRDGRGGGAAPPPPARTTTREAARRPDHPDARVAGGPRRGTGRARGRRTRAPRPRTRRRRRTPLRRGPCRARDGRHRGRLGGRPPARTCRSRPPRCDRRGVRTPSRSTRCCSTSTTSSPASCLPWRAPGERIDEPWLRLSPHVDLTDDDLERTAAALTAV